MYPPEDHSDQSSELLLAELIREQVLNRTREEIPHSVEVSVGEVAARDDGLVTVKAEIWAETESQKGILIGKGGAKVGEIGTAARRSLEARARRQGPPRPPGPRPPRTGAGTRTCSTASASSRRALPPTMAPRMFDARVEFDERGLVPCVAQDFASGEVLTLAYASEESLRLTRRDRRAALLQPLAGGDLAQRGNLGQRAEAAPAPLRLRRRRDRRPGRADRARLPHRRALLLPPRAGSGRGTRPGAGSPPATRRWPRSSARCAAAPPSAPRAATRCSCSTTRG